MIPPPTPYTSITFITTRSGAAYLQIIPLHLFQQQYKYYPILIPIIHIIIITISLIHKIQSFINLPIVVKMS